MIIGSVFGALHTQKSEAASNIYQRVVYSDGSTVFIVWWNGKAYVVRHMDYWCKVHGQTVHEFINDLVNGPLVGPLGKVPTKS